MNDQDKENYFKYLFVIIGLIISFVIYHLLNKDASNYQWWFFIRDMMPNFGASLSAIIILYFLFLRHGIFVNQNKSQIIDEKIQTVIQKVDNLDSKLNTITEGIGCIEKFHESFCDYDWRNLIESTEKEIVIVVYYFDYWFKNNSDYLEKFFRKPDTTMTLILSNPDKNNNLEIIKRLYKDHSETILKEKIENTKQKAINIINKSGANTNRLKIYLYPNHLNYAIQSFDKKKVALSVFETFREGKVKSPIFLLNLNNSEKTKQFIIKEIEGLIKESETLTLNN